MPLKQPPVPPEKISDCHSWREWFQRLYQQFASGLVSVGNIIVPKLSGSGILVDPDSPTFGWRDVTAAINTKGTGPANAVWTQYAGTSIYAFAFSHVGTTEAWVNFSLPHDYVPGTDIFINVHWSQTTADGTKAIVWKFDTLYAEAYATDAFPNAVTTVSVTTNCSSTVRQHMTSEVQLSTSGTLSGNNLSVGGLALIRVYRTAGSGADTSTQDAFLHFCDIHYQSTNVATKNKSPNYYT